jgi:hypothetical protein
VQDRTSKKNLPTSLDISILKQEEVAVIRCAYMRQWLQLAERLYRSPKHRQGPKHEMFCLHLEVVTTPTMMTQINPSLGKEATDNVSDLIKRHAKPRAKATLRIA